MMSEVIIQTFCQFFTYDYTSKIMKHICHYDHNRDFFIRTSFNSIYLNNSKS